MSTFSGRMAWHPPSIEWIRPKKCRAKSTLDYGQDRLSGIVGLILCLIRTS